MYHLRQIDENKLQSNVQLGNGYSVVDKTRNAKEFEEFASKNYKEDVCASIYAFVVSEKEAIHALNVNHENYIVTDKGHTFSNLTKRK